MVSRPLVENACYHCGDDCGSHPIETLDKVFCCTGCQLVYEILAENDLGNYYRIEKRPGINKKSSREISYAYLEDEETIQQLVDFQSDKITRISFLLPQIHCASCIWLLENLYRLDEGVTDSKVNFLKKEVSISFQNDKTNLRKLVELLSKIGYPPALNLGNTAGKITPVKDYTLFYQLGLAGFSFGNIMLLSFPEYLGLANPQSWERIFSLLSLFLAIPLLLYSGKPYLVSAWQGLRQGHLNIDVPLSLGILTLFFRSAYEILSHTGAGYLDSLAGLIFFLLIGRWFQQKTYAHLSFERDYKSYFPIAASLVKSGKTESIPLNKLSIGDRVLVKNEELIPADGMLDKGQGFIDYSFVTGEDDPVPVKPGERIYAGGRQIGEAIELTLVKIPSQSYLTGLWNDQAFQKETKPVVNHIADRAGKYFTIAILLIASLTFIYWTSIDLSIAINAATAVLIIACPCAVALSIPFTLGNTLRILSKRGFFLKNTLVVEMLQRVNTVVFDKTGTITEASNNRVNYIGDPLTVEQKRLVAALANQSNHPVSRAISGNIGSQTNLMVEDFRETPGVGVEGKVAGVFVQIGRISSLDAGSFSSSKNEGTAIRISGEIVGRFIFSSRLRKSFGRIVDYLKPGRSMFLLSGDSDRDRSLVSDFFPGENLLFRQRPKEKLAFIRQKQNEGASVLMIGDGLNDAGALQEANLGLVIAENTNNFTPACDAILDASAFEELPNFFDFTRQSIYIIYVSFTLAFLYNIVGLSFAVQGDLSPIIAAILMPLSSISVVLAGVLLSNFSAWRIFRNGK